MSTTTSTPASPMAIPGPEEAATNAILGAKLTPIEHKILVGFVSESSSPDLAAREVLKRLSAGGDDHLSAEQALRALKEDWYKIVSTGRPPSMWPPLKALLVLWSMCVELSAAVARRIPDPAHTRHLRELVYRRDRRRCCLCRLPRQPPCEGPVLPEPTFILPPALAHSLQDDALRLLMDAFLTPAGTSRLRDMLLDPTDAGVLVNTWLLRPEASRSFQDGYFVARPRSAASWDKFNHDVAKEASKAEYHLTRLHPEPGGDFQMDDGSWFSQPLVHCRLETEDPKQLPLPSSFLFQTHFKLAHAFHHFRVEERILEGWPARRAPSILSPRLQLIARSLWLCLVPKFVRTWCYRRLLAMGKARFPREVSHMVHRLPLGLYAKQLRRPSENNEPNALRLLEHQAPSIPAPRLIDTFETHNGPRGATTSWFIMTALPGDRATAVLHRMSYAERDQLADDLRAALAQLARVPNTGPFLFASASGGPIVEPRLAAGPCGPYTTQAAFNAQLAKPWEEDLREEHPGFFARTHRAALAHGDLVLLNVLVDRGRLSGLIDWEYANFMPEYWDCAKARVMSWDDQDALAVYRRVWGRRFDDEVEVLTWVREANPFGAASPD